MFLGETENLQLHFVFQVGIKFENHTLIVLLVVLVFELSVKVMYASFSDM